MPSRPVGVTDTPEATTVVDVDTVERPALDISTTTTADPGAAGTTLAVTSAAKFPSGNNYKIRVESEVMLVTAGAGTTSWTVTRGVDGTTAVAHTTGVAVYQVVAVQRVMAVDAERIITYKGRANAFRTPGRAGTAGQKIFAIHNASGSAVKVRLTKAWVDVIHAAAAGIAPTVIPPIVRLWKFTAVPTNGSTPTKVPLDSVLSSNASVTVWSDASADGTGSATTLTITLPAGTILVEEFAPRILVVGTSASTFTELFDRAQYFEDADDFVTLNAGEGVAIFLDYTVATANPTTDHWTCGMEWEEYTVA